MQDELAVNYCQLAVVSTDPPEVTAAFRAGLGATFTFLSDHERRAINELEIVEQTKPGFEHGLVALPYTFSLYPDLTIHRIYTGWNSEKDRKSTRLNSSHITISYAVFCLKK